MSDLEQELNSCEKLTVLNVQVLKSYPKEYQESERYVKLCKDLNQIRHDLDDQLKRFRKKHFEIAVVGREKSGKSSLLNAWIGFELLPSDRNRCTYTTTEIRSCIALSDQKYLIEYLSSEEFKVNYTNIANSHASKELQQKEYAEIDEKYEEIRLYLNKPNVIRAFEDFDEVKNELKSAISEVGHARAVKKICIWTPKISNSDHVVLYDVPGYDSPITLHKEQTKAKIAAVDAVLYAKKFIEPDLVDCELEILKITDSNDQYLKAKDKIVVALTNCDQATSAKDYANLIESNYRAWKTYEINESRVIPVCSLAELKGESPEGMKSKNDLINLNNGDTGFENLREAVNKLVNDSRHRIARQRCNRIKSIIRDFNVKLCDLVKSDFDIDFNTEIRETLQENEMNRIYNEWWAQEWLKLKEEFQVFYHNEIRSSDEPENVNFKELYDKLVEKTIRSIPATKRERQTEIYPLSIGDDGVDNPKKANLMIRDELALDAINSLDKITFELNGFLCNKLNKIIDWVRSKLWYMPEIRETLLGKNEEMEILLLKRSFDALVQRLARPATNIFLKYPRSKIERSKVLSEYQMEIIIINSFIINGRIVQRGIVQFLANGKLGDYYETNEIISHPIPTTIYNDKFEFEDDRASAKFYIRGQTDDTDSIREKKSKLSFFKPKTKLKIKLNGEASKSSDNLETDSIEKELSNSQSQIVKNENLIKAFRPLENQFDDLKFSRDANSLAKIQIEIEQDVNEFICCMKNSIYYGSGIQRYLYQELDKIRRKFLNVEDAKRVWWSLIDSHLKDPSSKTKIPAPKMADEIARRKQMTKILKEIKTLFNEL